MKQAAWWKHPRTWRMVGLLLALVLILIAAGNLDIRFRGQTSPDKGTTEFGGDNQPEAVLPKDDEFQLAAETDVLRLKLHPASGHFLVEDKRNGHVWRSFPDPDHWENEPIGGMWRRHLASPIMFQYVDFTIYNSQPKESNFVSLGGTVTDIKEIEGGVQWTYDMPALGLSIPVQIRVQDDFVETKIIDSGIREGRYSLIWVRLFPFLAAEHTTDKDGYLFIPDGSGALIRFDPNRIQVNRGYQEMVYGRDMSFQARSSYSPRYAVRMPVFGLKAGDKAMLAVIEEGAEYAEIFAAPAGLYSKYNWITAQQTYRSQFQQITNRNKGTGFITYNKEERFGTDRAVRYYFLDTDKADYVGMAIRYRQYLMEEKGLTRITPADPDHIPLVVTLLGGDMEDGLIGKRYVEATSLEAAGQIVRELRNRGIGQLSVTYLGWQKNGYSAYGGYLPVDSRLGGNKGMKKFVELAKALDVPVTLGVQYHLNNTGVGGFREQIHAIRDLAGTMQRFRWRGELTYMASMSFIRKLVEQDLPSYRQLGVDGLNLATLGSWLSSDYNTRFGSSRTEAITLQQEIVAMVRENMGRVELTDPNFYLLPFVDHIHQLPNDYSYDLFSDRVVPFAQIALHGLITYSSSDENERQQYTHDRLRDLEYGALPSYVFTDKPSDVLKEAHGIQPKSSHFADWIETVVEEYGRYNELLAGVQDQFIVNHEELAERVMATTYENGTVIIVNYSDVPYVYRNTLVPSNGYAKVEGGLGR